MNRYLLLLLSLGIICTAPSCKLYRRITGKQKPVPVVDSNQLVRDSVTRKIDSVYVPAAKASSCAFGGENLDTLFITTARVGLADDQLHTQPHAGGIFTFKPGVRGTQTYSFGI